MHALFQNGPHHRGSFGARLALKRSKQKRRTGSSSGPSTVLVLLLILTKRDFGTMFTAERRALNEKKVFSDTADKEQVRPIA